MILVCGFLIGGTIGIVLLNKKIEKFFKVKHNEFFEFIKTALSVTISAQIFIIPIMIINFNQFSTLFWLANILAAPIIGICTIYGFVVIFASVISIEIAYILAIPLNLLIKILMFIAHFVSNISFSNLLIITPNVFLVFLYYLIIFFVLYKQIDKKHKTEKILLNLLKKLLLIIFIIIIVFQAVTNFERKIIVNFIDVGQGDGCLITTETGKKILIDGGGSETYDVGKNVLLPYLLDKKINILDYVMISHFDTDHVRTELFQLWIILKLKI